MYNDPMFATTPPPVSVKNISLEAVTFVVLIVTVPPDKVLVPIVELAPVLIIRPWPAVGSVSPKVLIRTFPESVEPISTEFAVELVILFPKVEAAVAVAQVLYPEAVEQVPDAVLQVPIVNESLLFDVLPNPNAPEAYPEAVSPYPKAEAARHEADELRPKTDE